jgi:hypothetical protein
MLKILTNRINMPLEKKCYQNSKVDLKKGVGMVMCTLLIAVIQPHENAARSCWCSWMITKTYKLWLLMEDGGFPYPIVHCKKLILCCVCAFMCVCVCVCMCVCLEDLINSQQSGRCAFWHITHFSFRIDELLEKCNFFNEYCKINLL